jgi:hypothetical protein
VRAAAPVLEWVDESSRPYVGLRQGTKQMKSLSLSRHALSVCVATMLFVSCGGPQAQSWNPASPLQSSAKLSSESLRRAAGGSFSAGYTGTWKTKQGLFFLTHFRAKGSGAFIGRSSLKGKMLCGFMVGGANFTFRSKKHPTDAFRVSVNGTICSERGKPQYTVTGGKGKFSDASGSGTVSFSFNNSNHNFTSSWTGTLNF